MTTIPSRLTVTLHAISRWRERAPELEQEGTDDEIRARIGHALLHSRAVRLKNPVERALKSVQNGSIASFHHYSGTVIVVTDGAVVSVYSYDRARWEASP